MINSGLLAQIESIGKHRSPAEAIGVILKGKVIELPNRSSTPNSTFELRIADLLIELEVNRLSIADDDWLEMIVWHTHPKGLIGPSSVDMRNRLQGLKHLVVALTEEGPVPTFY